MFNRPIIRALALTLPSLVLLTSGCADDREAPISSAEEDADNNLDIAANNDAVADEPLEEASVADVWEDPVSEDDEPIVEASEPPDAGDDEDVASVADDEDEQQIESVDDPEPGQLTAGEWSDLTNWKFWRDLVDPEAGAWAEMEDRWSIYTHLRYPVVVTAGDVPMVDATVHLVNDTTETTIWTGRTDNLGRVELFSGAFGEVDDDGDVSIQVVQGDVTTILDDPEANPETAHQITFEGKAVDPPFALDLMLVVDTTGSMGDELDYLKVELENVITAVQTTYGENLDIRLSVNFYRDHKDAYVTKPFPFSEDIGESITRLKEQKANGGGDYPEAMREALENAIDEHKWSDSARARLLFLVADAPPHNEEQFNSVLHRIVRDAAANGIRFFPIAASGVDKDTEFLMRMLDIATGGTYIFLTSDSGVGGDHIEPTVGAHDVYYLNDLLVYVIERALQ